MSGTTQPAPAVAPRDDTSMTDAYLAHRADLHANASRPDAWFDQLQAAQPAPSGPPQEIPATETGDGRPWWRWLAGVQLPVWTQMGAVQQAMNPDRPQSGVNRVVDAVAKDVGLGAIEAPQAMLRGALGAGEQIARTADDVANWLNEHIADLRVDVPGLPAALGNPAKGVAGALGATRGVMAPRESITGNLVELATQWIVSARVMGGIATGLGVPAGPVAEIIKAFGAGAAGFDPQQHRLADLIQQAAPNPLTEFLQSNQEDPALLARLKTGLEMGGLGMAAEGVIKGLRLLREWHAARGVPGEVVGAPGADGAARIAASAEAAPAPGGGQMAPGTAPWGAPLEPVARDYLALPGKEPASVVDEAAAAAFQSGRPGPNPVRLNLLRIEGPDDIRDALGRIDTMLPAHISESLAETASAARMLGMAPEELARGTVTGEVMSARQITAARILMRSAAEDLVALAEKAAGPTASDIDRAAFNKAFAVSSAMQQMVRQNTTAIARALSAHRIVAANDSDAVKAVQELLARSGGAEATSEMAARVAALKDPEMAAEFVARTSRATGRDQIMMIWNNVLLSNPVSQAANVLDTASATLMQVPEHWVASLLGNSVPPGEAAWRLYGIQRSIRDAFRLAGRSWKTGETSLNAPATRMETRAGDLGADMGFNGTLADYLRMAEPLRVMQAGDEFTKVLNFQGGIYGQAYRRATEEGLVGGAAEARARELANAPPAWLDKLAQDEALANTFNTPLTGGAASFARTVDAMNMRIPTTEIDIPLGRLLVATFIRTPYNIMSWVGQRTPLAFLGEGVQADLAAGGAKRDLALARIVMGSAIMSTVADFTLQGRVTGAGPTDPLIRRPLEATGWKPYSLRIGDEYWPFGRFSSVGGLMAMAATAVERLGERYMRDPKTVDMDGEPVQANYGAAAVMALAQTVQDKSMITGFSRLVTALADSEHRGDAWLRQFAASWVPAGLAALERSTDDVRRRSDDVLSALEAKIPGVAQNLAPRLDIWGSPVRVDGGFWNLISPSIPSQAKDDPISQWMVDTRKPMSPIPQHQSFVSVGGVSAPIELSPEAHNRLIALAGNEGKWFAGPGGEKMGAHDYLNAILRGAVPGVSDEWRAASDDHRALMVRQVITGARGAAHGQLMQENHSLRMLVEQRARETADGLTAPRAAPAGPSGPVVMPRIQ